MCAPAVFAVISLVTTAVSMGVKADAQKKKYNAIAENAERNRKLMNEMAEDVREVASDTARRHADRVRHLLAKQRSSYKGIDTSEGTPLLAMDDTMLYAQLDATMIQKNSERKAWYYHQRGLGYKAEGADALAAGKTAITGTIIGGVSEIGRDLFAFTQLET